MELSRVMQRTLKRLAEEESVKPGSWHYPHAIRESSKTLDALANRGLVESRNNGFATQYRIKEN